ncbi:NADPH-dependent oxidoreductase [Paenibacillus swuensis]|uniref:NADPH-dependent oxidoreductase n=1 Tax=Paenibacillus swuensis TaxID=1178515 RepID=A0A172TPZ6_9BACL|nr:oxygen-insensitive NADPH nitroreductase [Paenibacillus swuensis]ANE48984.1 NADPH-dependent oxidoreductase [Paenibacillus swuensis]
MKNETISLMLQHQSIRKFKSDPVPPEHLHTIMECAQKASTSSNMQAYSVINVTDPELRSQLAILAGNQIYVEQAPVFLVWCADLHRLQGSVSDQTVKPTAENFLVSSVDAALASQNAALAAESMGLGIVYIGGIRNQLEEVIQLLQLPELVYPVFGMCIGKPDQEPSPHPRMPVESILHENKYSTVHNEELLRQYNETISNYMDQRTQGQRKANWSQMMESKLSQPDRILGETLQKQGFGFR